MSDASLYDGRTPEPPYVCQSCEDKDAEIEQLNQWVADCQSGMYINCVYCGHRYGPQDKVPSSMADVLKEHCEQCPKHPLSHAKQEIERLHSGLRGIRREFGHKSINNGTATLAQFIDMLVSNDTAAAKRLKDMSDE